MVPREADAGSRLCIQIYHEGKAELPAPAAVDAQKKCETLEPARGLRDDETGEGRCRWGRETQEMLPANQMAFNIMLQRYGVGNDDFCKNTGCRERGAPADLQTKVLITVKCFLPGCLGLM